MSRPPRTVYLVSCVKGKRRRPARAKDLYTSDWFKKARAYVETGFTPWFILSAKYGLVAPNRIIRPYDVTLLRMSAKQRRAWSSAVERRMKTVCRPSSRLVFLAGLRGSNEPHHRVSRQQSKAPNERRRHVHIVRSG